jgi:hypothetical protein
MTRVFFECAETLGRRWAARPSVDLRPWLQQAFVTCLARQAEPQELARLERFYREQEHLAAASSSAADGPKPPPPAQVAAVALARTLLNLDEFVTRE